MASDALQSEIQRLEAILSAEERPDPVDVATVYALRSDEVREHLEPVLAAGGQLRGVVLHAAGTVSGVAQLNFELNWAPGTSHVTPPPVVCAVIHIQPPRVIKAAAVHGAQPEAGLGVGPLARPAGPIPTALKSFQPMPATEAVQLGVDSNRSLVDFLNRERMTHILSNDRALQAGTPRFDTTGTKCSSLLCFEKTSDDLDDN
jgi:hypothetical protein